MASSSWMHVAVAQAGSVEDGLRQSWQAVAASQLPAFESGVSSWQQCYPAIPAGSEASSGRAEFPDVEAIPTKSARAVAKPKGRPPKKRNALSKVRGVPSCCSGVQSTLEGHCHESSLGSAMAIKLGDLGIGKSGLMAAIPKFGQSLHRVLQGYSWPSVNTEPLFQVMALHRDGSDLVDDDYNKLSGTFLSAQQPFHHQSVIARAAELDVNRKTLSLKLFRLASAQCTAARAVRHFIEKEAVAEFAAPQRLCYVECVCYDETPLRFGSKGVVQAGSACDGDVDELSSGALSNDVAVTTALSATVRHSAICKTLQSRQSFGMLLQHHTGMIHFFGATVNALQCMQRGTAEVLAKALQASSAVSESSRHFQVHTRIACTDRASANTRAELLVIQERGGLWQSLQHHCEVHKTAGSFKRVFDQLLRPHITGLLHLSLSLRYGSGMPLFRAALKAEVRERLQVMVGTPSPESVLFRQECIQLFLPGCSNL
eukprot:910497-Amphidinium_carterae.1